MENAPPGAPAVSGLGGVGGGYPDSVDSSPRSRGGESWDEPFPSAAKLRLMCSYGGQIVPRPHDKSLCYLGGETRIVVVERHTTLADLSAKISRSLLNNRPFSLKYQLPSEDLDSLISVTTDEDLDNMIEEYDRITSSSSHGSGGNGSGGGKPSRLRLFLFPVKIDSAPSSIGSLLDDSKSETWFVDALNGAIDMGGVIPRGLSADSPASSVNCLLGLEDDQNPSVTTVVNPVGSVDHGGDPNHNLQQQQHQSHQIQLPRPESSGKLSGGKHQEVHSVPDSPMMENSSSFGSTSSAPSLSNLPPIRVRPDDRSPRGFNGGLEEHFAQMNVSGQKHEEGFAKDGAFVALHHQHPASTTINVVASSVTTSAASAASPTENPNHGGWALSSEDEKSDHAGMRPPPQFSVLQQQKPNNAYDPPISERPLYYQERTAPVPVLAGWNMVSDQKQESQNPVLDPNYRVQVQVPEQSYVLQADQLQQHQHHQQQQQQQQQYIQANPHLIQHHPSTQNPHLVQHHPSTPLVPMQSYYQVHHQIHPQQQLPQGHPYNSQIPMYFLPVQQNPAYTVPMQQPGLADGAATITTSGKPSLPVLSQVLPSRGHPPPPKPELSAATAANIYRTGATTTAAVPQQSPSPQFMGYHPMHHHPSQSATASAYGYEFANPAPPQQMYYTQAASTPLPTQYQTISSSAAMISDAQPQLQQPDLKQNRASS